MSEPWEQVLEKLNKMEQNMATKADIQELRQEFYSEMDARFSSMKEYIDDRFSTMKDDMNTRFNQMDEELYGIREQLAHVSELEPTIYELKSRVDDHDHDIRLLKRSLSYR